MSVPTLAELPSHHPTLNSLLKRASRIQVEMLDYSFSQWEEPDFQVLKEHFHRLLNQGKDLLIAAGTDVNDAKHTIMRLMEKCQYGATKAQERAWMTIDEAIGTVKEHESTSVEELHRERNMYKSRCESLQKEVDILRSQIAAISCS
jgi:hypothetical protein